MNFWLVFWLSLAALAPIGIALALWAEDYSASNDYDGLLMFLVVAAFLFIGLVGVLGTLGWVIAWGFG